MSFTTVGVIVIPKKGRHSSPFLISWNFSSCSEIKLSSSEILCCSGEFIESAESSWDNLLLSIPLNYAMTVGQWHFTRLDIFCSRPFTNYITGGCRNQESNRHTCPELKYAIVSDSTGLALEQKPQAFYSSSNSCVVKFSVRQFSVSMR